MTKYIITAALCLVFFSSSYGDESIQKINAETMQQQINELQQDYTTKIAELTQKIKDLEKEKAEQEEKAELEELLKSAQNFSNKEKKKELSISKVFTGGQRQLQALNPNISMTGDFFGSVTSSDAPGIKNPSEFTDGRNQFNLREAEFHIIAPLDPYTRGKFFLGIPGSGDVSLVDMIGEAYMEWLNLPLNMNLKIGKYNTQFGILNRWHTHGLPQIDRPSALTNLFGTENFGGFGVSANFLLPKLWADVNEFDVEIVTGGGGISFDESHDNVILVSHLKNYFDLNRDSYLELGASVSHGYNDQMNSQKTTIGAIDLTYKWSPVGGSHYKTVEFRNEFFLSHRETMQGDLDRFGFYSYLSSKTGYRFWVGMRYGYSQIPFTMTKEHEWDLSPYVDFWQSEFVMLRLQYSYTQRSFTDNDHSVFIQSVWSMGPHKHDAY